MNIYQFIDIDSNQSIDPNQFLKELEPDQMGLFEPLSGIMLLNIAETDFQDMVKRWETNTCTEVDIETIRTINHETYHFIQTIASGYMYDRQRRIFAQMRQIPLSEKLDAFVTSLKKVPNKVLEAICKWVMRDDQESLRRFQNIIAVLNQNALLNSWKEDARAGDYSLAGVLLPHFFKYQEKLSVRETKINEDGLSIIGLIEGSAVVHAQLLMGGSENLQGQIEAELETLPQAYRQIYALTKQYCGDRTIELLLPTTALALQYTYPHNAYLTLLNLLAKGSPGDGLTIGREINSSLPKIKEAGAALGKGIDVHKQQPNKYKYMIYDSALRDLEEGKWNADSYTLLAQPEAMHLVPTFPCGLLTRNSFRGIGIEQPELVSRMLIMSIGLRVKSRRRLERQILKEQRIWAQEIVARFMSALSSNDH
jgi:hypothetical protein